MDITPTHPYGSEFEHSRRKRMVGKKGGSSKTPASSGVDDSYIVFSNAKDNGKAKKVESQGGSSKNSVSKGATSITAPKILETREKSSKSGPGQNATDEGPSKKPIVKPEPTWTAWLPVQTLSDYCIKTKQWMKPEYTMVGYFYSDYGIMTNIGAE